MKRCEECYTADSRATPLLSARECLENHTQYICSSCGRCICIEADEKRGVRRWNFPFSSSDNAILYLRTADYTEKQPCGVYGFICASGRKTYKILPSGALDKYLCKNPDKVCQSREPLFTSGVYREFTGTQIRKLTADEIEKYLSERK